MANWWKLKVVSGERAGETFTLKPEKTIIGRKKGDIVLRKDAELSGQHAELVFERDTNTMILMDLASRNGCRVNGEKVTVQRLAPGDKIRVGTTEFILEAPEEPEAFRTGHPQFLTKPDSLQIRGFWPTLTRLFFSPQKFFQAVAIQKNVGHAFRFAALIWAVGWLLTAILTIALTLLLKMNYDLKSVLAIVMAGLTSLLLIPLLVPLSAVLFHLSARIFRGHASFGKAFQIACYSTAFTLITCVLDLVPKAGKYLSLIPIAYSMFVMAVAAVSVYEVRKQRAYAAWGLVGFLAVCGIFLSQQHAARIKNAFFAAQINVNPAEVVFIMKETYHDALKDAVVGTGEQRIPAGN